MDFTLKEFLEDCKKTIKPAFFISLTFLSQSLIVTTDIVIIGWLGIEYLAAAGYAVRLYMPLFLLSLGVSLCITVMAGQAMGAKNYDQLRLIVRRLLVMGLGFGTICSFLLIVAIRPVMLALGSDEALISMAETYTYYFAFVIPFGVFTVGIRNFMTVVGRSAPFMYLSFAMVALNGFLDYGLAYGKFGLPVMGLQGIALSSTVVNFFSAFVLVIMCKYMQPYKKYKIFEKTGGIRTDRILDTLKISLPLSSKMVLESLFYAIAFFIVGTFGSQYLASYQIVYQVDTNIFLFGIGAAAAISTRVAYATGAKDKKGVKLAALSGFLILTIWASFAGILAYTFSEEIAHFLIRDTATKASETHLVIIEMLFILMLYQVFHGLSLALGSAIEGMGHSVLTMKAFIVNILGIGIPLAIGLSYYTPLGFLGVFWATGFAMLSNTFVLVFIWRKQINKLESKV